MAGRTFSGNVRIAKVNGDGVVQGAFIGLLNTVKCELVVPAPDKIQQISRMNGTVGQPISTALVPKPTSLNMSIDDTTDQRILAYALNGITAAYSQSSATVTDEAVTSPAAFNDWAPLANRHVSSVVVKHTTGSPTYVAGTDYVADLTAGFIRILESGDITEGQALKVSYAAAAISGTTVQGSKVAATLLRVEVNLQDLVDGSEAYFIVPIYNANSSGNQDLFGKNMLVAGLTGDMFLPPQGTAAYALTGGAPFILTSVEG
jgi:hypothetical protein